MPRWHKIKDVEQCVKACVFEREEAACCLHVACMPGQLACANLWHKRRQGQPVSPLVSRRRGDRHCSCRHTAIGVNTQMTSDQSAGEAHGALYAVSKNAQLIESDDVERQESD